MMSKLYPTRLAALFCLASVGLPPVADAQTREPAISPDVVLNDATYPVVITPTRLRQSLADVPASVTVITAETLQRHGITRLEEALRLVPGMLITQAMGNDFRINYHGTRNIAPRRLNVLIDGVSMYTPALSSVEWPLLPVTIDDIDRIEVIRGPDSSSYGPNSMMAVVNILTKNPKDVERGMASIAVDTRDTLDATARMATTLGPTSMRLTVNKHLDRGYDQIAGNPGHDGTRINRLMLSTQTDLANGSTLNVQGAYVGGLVQQDDYLRDQPGKTFPDRLVDTGLLSARWTKALASDHEVQVSFSHMYSQSKQEWISCVPPIALWPESRGLFLHYPDLTKKVTESILRGNGIGLTLAEINALDLTEPYLAAFIGRYLATGPSAFTDLTCGNTNSNGHHARTQIELQDTYIASDKLRIVGGLGLRYQMAHSQTYLQGTADNHIGWLFGHAEYRPLDWLTANVGGYSESNSLSGNTFSPRVALNLKLSESQTLRAVASKGTRTPDLFEERANWEVHITDLHPPQPPDNATSGTLYTLAQAQGNLTSEQNWSRELGYLLALKRLGLTFDARVFDERLSHLISTVLAQGLFNPDNSGSVRLTGAELQAQWDVSNTWSTWVSYAYLLNRDASITDEKAQYARHSGAFGASVSLSDAWRASVARYIATGDGFNESRYGRTDLTLAYAFSLGKQLASTALTLRYLDSRTTKVNQSTYVQFNSSYDSQFSIQAQLRVAF